MTDKNGRLSSYTTPVIDVQGMYPGGSDGAFDLREAQGWVWSDKSRKRRASDRLKTPPRYLPRQFAIDPPTYGNAAPLITTTQPTPPHDKLVPPTASRQVFLPLTHEPLDQPPQECKDHVGSSTTTVLSVPTTVLVASTVLPAPSASSAPTDASPTVLSADSDSTFVPHVPVPSPIALAVSEPVVVPVA